MSASKKIFAGLLIVGSLGAGATSAAASLSEVPSGMIGVFKNANYDGLLGYRAGGYGLKNMSSVANDEMSSWTNKTNYTGAWYHHANGEGACVQMNSNYSKNYVGFWDNDRASSWRTNGGC